MHLTHNENIETLEVAIHHLELEEAHLEAAKPSTDVYMAGPNSHGGSGHKRK